MNGPGRNDKVKNALKKILCSALFIGRQTLFTFFNFRKKKGLCFIQAFSDSPQSFADTFGSLQRVVSCLKCEQIFFLPRYHVDVVADIDSKDL